MSSSMVDQDVQYLQEWISKQPHLPQDHEDAWLEKFLKGSKNSIEKCKETIDNYYTTRTLIPEFFSDRDPTSDEMKSVAKLVRQVYLPNKTPEGYTVWMAANTEEYFKVKSNNMAGTKRLILVFDAQLCLESSNEWIFIYDVKYQTPQTCIDLTPSFLKKFNLALKIFVHGEDYKELYKYVPKDILPHEYGGKAGSIKDLNDECQKKLEQIRDWFIQEEEKKTDESKRPAEVKSKLLEDNFGVDGSFRKLNVD